MRNIFHFLLLLFLVATGAAHAQIDASLSLEPKNPAPFQEVAVTLTSYSFDVNLATITWSVNGKQIASGVGRKKITLPLGDVGQQIPLKVETILPDGSSVVQQVTISPQSVDIIYEATESYVPPFYEGRSLPAEGASIRVTALPTMASAGKKLADANLSFSWYVNDEYLPNASGLGKSSLETALHYLRESTTIRVMVRSPEGNVAEKEISITPHKVLPLLYKYDNLLGVDLSQTFTRRLELTEEITLSFEPFFLSTRKMESTALFGWYLDGLPVTPQEKKLLSLRPKDNAYGSRWLRVTAEQTKRRLQNVESSVEVIFDTRN